MTEEALVAWLYRRTSAGIRWGLDRTESLLAGVDSPHRRFQSLHVGGTNGKGSVALLCAEALGRTGQRVGLYTSPHLVSFRERIRINGQPIREAELETAVEQLRPLIEASGATFFEATTAIAFLCFANAGVDTAVVEVGLGGRLDATNVISPLACAVTNIALDHTEYLGTTPQSIAAEKAGIFKPGVPALTAERDPAALAVLRGVAARVGAPFAALEERAAVEDLRLDAGGTQFTLRSSSWGERRLRLQLLGAHQARNAALAAELLAALPSAVRPGWEQLADAFAAARWPGRLQRARAWGANWLFDVAHNPAGVAALTEALDHLALPRPLVLLCAVLNDKDWMAMLPSLAERVDAVVLTVAPSAPEERRWAPAAAARALSGARASIREVPNFEQALQRAATLAGHGTVVVTGSVFTVGDALRLLEVPAT